jgi:hypothetical protein
MAELKEAGSEKPSHFLLSSLFEIAQCMVLP